MRDSNIDSMGVEIISHEMVAEKSLFSVLRQHFLFALLENSLFLLIIMIIDVKVLVVPFIHNFPFDFA